MNKKKIEKPRVFISYAWSSNEYEQKVIEFASRLVSDGIDVLLDKWNIDPGADTINFMEKCVKDESVNYVLILLDKKYAEKADERKGGVGIETQIISNKVYNDVDQNKFIPIIFERGLDGSISVPLYLKSRFYYDLTKEDSEEEYVKLVKNIYGYEIYKKPELGEKPKWVSEEVLFSPLKFKISNSNDQNDLLNELIDQIKNLDIKIDINSDEDVIDNYNKILELRNCAIEIFLKYNSNDFFLEDVFDFYEKLAKMNVENHPLKKEIIDSFIHETFIYLISALFKKKKYELINTIIIKSYFKGKERSNICQYFYHYNYHTLEKAKNELDKKVYFSPIAQIWIENIYEPKFSKQDFVFADLLIYNLSILFLDSAWLWFPVSYVYSESYNSTFSFFAVKLKSQYELERYSGLFGTRKIEEIKNAFKKMVDFSKEEKNKYRYPNCFEYAELFLDSIQVEEIGQYN